MHARAEDQRRPGRRGVRTALAIGGWLLVVATLGAYLLGESGAGVHPLELFAHFRTHYALALAAALVLFACARAWRSLAMGGVVFALCAASIARWWIPVPGEPGDERLRLAVANVQSTNTAYERTLDELLRHEPDLAILIEVTAAWMEAIERDDRWHVVHAKVGRFSGWIVLLAPAESDVRISHIRQFQLTPGTRNIDAVEARVHLGGRTARLLGVHARSPTSLGNLSDRDAQLDAIGAWVKREDSPAIVAGDLNATVWSPRLRTLTAEAGLTNSMRGHGPQGSWPSSLPGPLRLGIDHVLLTGELVSPQRFTGDPSGSDHAPVIVDLAWDTSRDQIPNKTADTPSHER